MKTKWKIFGVIFLLLVFGIIITPVLLNYPEQYSFNEDKTKVFYGSKEIQNFTIKEYKHLSNNIIKDSGHVFFNGKIVSWADASTFVSLGNDLFKDKNGIYYVTKGLYSKYRLKPVSAELDVNSFHQIEKYGSIAYKDKNGIYICDNDPFALFSTNRPVKKVNIPGLDVNSFTFIKSDKGGTNKHWYGDSLSIYWGDYGKLDLCKEIDRNSFEILTYNLSKDKNHVYYLTNYLRTKESKITRKPGYSILHEADAATFNFKKQYSNVEMVVKNYMLFEDKNFEWVIKFVAPPPRSLKGYEFVIYKQNKL